MSKTFSEIFSVYLPEFDIPEIIGESKVDSVYIDTNIRRLDVKLAFDSLVEARMLFDAENRLQRSRLGLNLVKISPVFGSELFTVDYYPQLVLQLGRQIASLNGTMRDSKAELNGDRLIITLEHGGQSILQNKKLDKALEKLIFDQFSVKVNVEFAGVVSIDADNAVFIEKEIHNQQTVKRAEQTEAMEIYESTMAAAESRKQVRKDAAVTIEIRSGDTLIPKIVPSTAHPLYGSAIKENKFEPISSLALDTGKTVIWGDVFHIDKKTTKDGKKNIYSFYITDYTGSMSLKVIENVKKCDELDSISKGMTIIARGEVEYDKYDREISMRTSSIGTVSKVKIVDNAPKKRVELHLHTNMSQMDAVTSASDLIKRAHDWGHPAVAITDHGVAQAFPEAMNTVEEINKKDEDFKVIYGVESYFIDDIVYAVSGDGAGSFDGEFICFDLETTGLSAKSEKITEIGAVKIKDRQIIDTFNMFVNPDTV